MTKPSVSDAEIKKAEGLMVKARAQLLMDQPFFGALALRLKPVPVLDPDVCSTAAVDGKNLFFYPPFVNDIAKNSKAPVLGLVAHEVLHCVFNHMQRRGFRNHQIWNVACDYTINQHLLDNKFILPEGGIVDTDKKYVGWNAEAIYTDLTNGDEPPPMPKWGLVLDPAGQADAALSTEWEIAVRAAAQTAKMQGKLPGGFESLIEEILEPLVDWRSVLWQFAASMDRTEYSWRRPNRAYISEDIYLPSLRNETIGPLVIAVDTSGSVSDKELTQFWSEIVCIARQMRPEQLVIIHCDAKVHAVEELDIDTINEEPFKAKGRGGTDFAPAVNKAREDFPDAEALIYLTDMECSSYGTAPDYPTLWISTRKKYAEPPFGQVVYMPLDDNE